MLKNPGMQANQNGYILELNKLWNSRHENDSPDGKPMSDRCKAILKDFINELMETVVYDLNKLMGPESTPIVNSLKSHVNVNMKSLNDLRQIDTNPNGTERDEFKGPPLDKPIFKTELIGKYLELTETINNYMTKWSGDAGIDGNRVQPDEKEKEYQFTEYYKKMYEDYDRIRDT